MTKKKSYYEKFIKSNDNISITKHDFLKITNYLEKEIELVKESELKYKSLFEMSGEAILIIENNTFVECNLAVVKMLGYESKEQLLNTHPSVLSPEKQPDGRLSFEKAQEMMEIAIKKGSNHFEWMHTRANGENFPVEVWLSKVVVKNKFYINTIWRDLTEKKKAEQTIQKNIEEKETLLKEIHHRVKNNLQIITSLLNLQANSLEDEKVKKILFQSKTRIESMCKVHEMLYSSKNFHSINYSNYLNDLIYRLLINAKGDENQIYLKIDVKNIFFNINTAIPLGLLINELITNTLKYAFPNNQGIIKISIKAINENHFKLIYHDNGIGYSKNINFEKKFCFI